MRKIILISCSSKKGKVATQAENLYISPLFRKSLEYAKLLNPEHIFILSAKHHLVKLDDIIEPYNTTLSNVSKKDPSLEILSSKDKQEWGKIVLKQLSKYTDFKKHEILILGGKEYFLPLSSKISSESMILNGRIGERLKFLNTEIARFKSN
ncbi:DUF6884 domain-containing protein [Maribacter thermophilus]|uniref:DUF6884 domain-containing protein n=1 Tax=Maribacter thermophilus TaxID=1197874 RepID=UPI0006415E7F|nr:DUF6884 domain-containing protein [Maribacter thermophilus]